MQLSENSKGLIYHPQTCDFNLLYLTIQVHLDFGFQNGLLIWSILLILHATSTGECVVHGEFLLEILDLSLILPDQKRWIQVDVNGSLV